MTTPQVEPNFNLKVQCPCLDPACTSFGTPRKKAWGDGLRHVRGCPCRRCVGGRQRGKARVRENRVARDIGGTREPLSGGLSGADVRAGLWSVEETSNEAVVRGLRRWWTSATVRAKVVRLFARTGEAHALILSWDGRCQVVVVSYEDWVSMMQDPTFSGRAS